MQPQNLNSPFQLFSQPIHFTPLITKLVRTALYDKYQQQFNLFRKISINHIMYDYTRSPAYQDYKDAICDSQNIQFMRRMYQHIKPKRNKQESESEDRIRFLANCKAIEAEVYIKVSYQYPTMYITGTQNIFLNRLQRKKSQRAVSYQSESSSSFFQGDKKGKYYVSFDSRSKTSIPNKYLTSSGFESSQNMTDYLFHFSNPDSKSYSQNLLDIYENIKSEQSSKKPSIKLNAIDQINIDGLICDFESIKSFKKPPAQQDAKKVVNKLEQHKSLSPKSRISKQKILKFQVCENCHHEQIRQVKKKTLMESATRSTRKRIVQQKAKRLLQKIQNEESFEFSNKKFIKQ